MIALRGPVTATFPRLTIRVPGDPVLSAHGQVSIQAALGMRADRVLLEWIPVKSRLQTVWLNGFVPANNSRLAPLLFVSRICVFTH